MRKCKHCGTPVISRNAYGYCAEHRLLYSGAGRARFQFTFNFVDYPDIFDLDAIMALIKMYGWRSTNGPNKNLNGLTRDHKVSVNEAIRCGYDPHYIKHPLNCEFMLQSENIRKGTKSSMNYSDLVQAVDDYEIKKASN